LTSDDVATRALDAIVAAGIPFMVTGSFARNLYALPRSTKDIDFVVEAPEFSPASIARHLGADFQMDDQVYFETITGTTRYVIRHRHSPFVIEFFLLSDDAHDRERFGRRRQVQILGRPVFVATPEDVVIAKLRWSDRGRRPKDRQDARDVIALQTNRLNWPYVRHWCQEHGTLDLLEQIQAELREQL
jgi:hypothetical protein